MRVVFLIICSFLLVACGMFDSSTYSLPKFSNWTGRNISDLTTAWGRPDRITTAWNGNWEYRYSLKNPATKAAIFETRTQTFVGPNHTTYGVNVPTHASSAPEASFSCVVVAEVNAKNIILSMRQEGECPLKTPNK